MMNIRTALFAFSAGLLLPALTVSSALAQKHDRYQKKRLEMVRAYIEAEGVKNPRVLEAMRSVPRHKFLRRSLRKQAYQDGALAIGHKQTISPPFIVAYMTEIIDPQPDERVLEIGTGSGYQAAVLSSLVKEVFTIEIVEPLGKSAAGRLRRLGYKNVTAKVGDGYKGWPEHAPFDKIIVTCSPENVPKPLVEQLKEGGKMIVPLGQRYQQVFHLFEKKEGKLVETKLIPTLFVPMTGRSEDERQIKPDPANPSIVNGGFETDRNDDGRADNWHYQRQTKLFDNDAPQGKRYIRFENAEPKRPAQMLQGLALDGRRVAGLHIDIWVKYDKTIAGEKPHEQPSLVVHYYDRVRRPIGESVVSGWLGTGPWQQHSIKFRVPKNAREAIVRIGLNGATGTLSVDGVKLAPIPR